MMRNGPVTTGKKRRYGVPVVRGPDVTLANHSLACEGVDELLYLAPTFDKPLAADLFCGAGGLSLGLQRAGFEVIFGVDNDRSALETHRSLFPGLTLERDLLSEEAIDEVVSILKGLDLSLIAGGPPCQPFSRAGRSKIRSLVQAGTRAVHDERRDLWHSFIDIVEEVHPPAVLFENVPDMALGDDMLALRTIVDRLEASAYAVHVRLLDAWRYGVPQHRQRLIVVALADGIDFKWPKERSDTVTVRQAIGDLPRVKGGWRPKGDADGYIVYSHSPDHWFRRRARAGLRGKHRLRVYDHITRPVREDDALAFKQMRPGGTYAELDPGLKRYRDDIFDDKYKRLHPDELSRTITAHISQDGYWYIHPWQSRTLTVREAARLQTFPDRVRFAGPPSAAFRQIGNAVPPLLAEVVGKRVKRALDERHQSRFRRFLVSEELAAWIEDDRPLRLPWLLADTAWCVIAGEMTLAGASAKAIDHVWPLLAKLPAPQDILQHSSEVQRRLDDVGRSQRWPHLLAAAQWLAKHPEALDSVDGLSKTPGVTPRVAALAGLCALGDDLIIASAPVLRVAARFWGRDVDRTNRLSHGRMAIALMVGGGKTARSAHVGLIELGNSLCHPRTPDCSDCPLASWCSHASVSGGETSG
jgi:DNA (cytosine-5)-methyltransferase 1